jgi:outer membrane protein OmpA-like peptidoglycan-associated protein
MLLIAGHTDAAGSDEYNLILSRERAQAVRTYLIEHGIAPDRLIAKGYGEAYPIASNATEAGREENRRSEFIRLDASTRVSP